MPELSNPADFIMRIINENDIRIGHEARIMKKKKAMLEENYKKLIVRASEGNFSQSSVKSESRKLAKAQFLEIEKSDAKMKKISEEDVKNLYAERIDLFIRTYHTYKEPVSYAFNQDKETPYEKCLVPDLKPSGFYTIRRFMSREYTLYFRSPIQMVATFLSWTIFGLFFLLVYSDMTPVTVDTVVGIRDLAGASFGAICCACFLGLNAPLVRLPDGLNIFTKEFSND